MPTYTSPTCPQCAAPLPELAPDAHSLVCEYCGTRLQVERPPAPEGHTPDFASSELSPALLITIANAQKGARLGAKLVLLPVLLGILVPLLVGGVVLFRHLRASAGPSLVSSVPALIRLPITCGTNQTLLISGKTYDGPGPVVTAGTLCKVTIRDSTLKSDVVVRADNLADVTLEDSTLIGRSIAVELGTNAKLHVTGKSELQGDQAAIEAGVNAEITQEGGTLRGKEAALHTEVNAKVRLKDVTISAQETALALGGSPELNLEGGSVRAEEAALRTGGSANLRLTDVAISSRETAILLDDNTTLELRGGTVHGEKSALFAKSHLKLTVKGTRMEGSESALDVGTNAQVTLSKGSELHARDQVLAAKGWLTLRAEGAKLIGGREGLALNGGSNVRLLENTLVHADEVGLHDSNGLTLRVEDSRIEAGKTAVAADRAQVLTLLRAHLQGGQNALLLLRKPPHFEVTQSTLEGAQSFDGRAAPPVPVPVAPRVAAVQAPARPKVVKSELPPFNAAEARRSLDDAVEEAALTCRRGSSGKRAMKLWMAPGFLPDGRNTGARMTLPSAMGTPEAACAEAIFRKVRIPPFRKDSGEDLLRRRAFYLK